MDNQSSEPSASVDDNATTSFPAPQLQPLNPVSAATSAPDGVVPVTLTETADHELIFNTTAPTEVGSDIQFATDDTVSHASVATPDDDMKLYNEVEKLASVTPSEDESPPSPKFSDDGLAIEPAPLVMAEDNSDAPISLSSMAATTGDDMARPDMTGEPTIPNIKVEPNFDPSMASTTATTDQLVEEVNPLGPVTTPTSL